jgi:hypothetical protein
MATLFVRHQVSDYEKWRKVYEGIASLRTQAGVTDAATYQADGSANDVIVTHDFGSIAEAKAFLESPQLREAMDEAGVVGAPTVWIANKA